MYCFIQELQSVLCYKPLFCMISCGTMNDSYWSVLSLKHRPLHVPGPKTLNSVQPYEGVCESKVNAGSCIAWWLGLRNGEITTTKVWNIRKIEKHWPTGSLVAAWVEISTLMYWSTVVTRVDCSKKSNKIHNKKLIYIHVRKDQAFWKAQLQNATK